MKKFLWYLKVFNRGGGGKEIFRKDVLQVKDEVLVLDIYSGYESDYKRAQRIKDSQSIAVGIINGEFVTADDSIINCPVAVCSDRVARKKQAVNLYVDAEFFELNNDRDWIMHKKDEVGIVFFYFAKYCEKNMDEIKSLLKFGEDANPETAWLCFAFKIFQEFWKSYRVNMIEMADFPESIDFCELLQENLVFEDDLIADFVKIVRAEIKKWHMRMKNEGKGNGNEILYSDEFIWIPVKILNQIFLQYGILGYRYQFLDKLREENFLITDGQGFSRKLQVSGNRYETYKFRRDLFHVAGMVDIVELGKEEGDVER